MSADTLTFKSRNFYEFTRFKLLGSICLGGASLLMLGYCSIAGGIAKGFNLQAANHSDNDDFILKGNQNAAAGYGFACFFFILAFFMLVALAIYVSPLLMGSPLEKKMVQAPSEMEEDGGDYQAYEEQGINKNANSSAPPLNAV